MKFQVKAAIAVVLGLVVYVFLAKNEMVPGSFTTPSVVPVSVNVANEAPVQVAETAPVGKIALPGFADSTKGKPVRAALWAWNAQMGLMLANGGAHTKKDSLIEKAGVNLTIARQDDTAVNQRDLVKFATALSEGDPNPSVGIHYTAVMGDGYAAFLDGINQNLSKLGKEYRAEVVGSLGYSGNEVSGEDAFIGPPEWRDDPSLMRGQVIIGVLRDGDWNIALDYGQKSSIPNNPDETTWDNSAMNWIAAPDYITAVKWLISGKCETRPIVVNGKKTGDTDEKCSKAVVTWTPGDVMIAKQLGGLVKIWSTKENRYQMPNVLIGIHKWNVENPTVVTGILDASFKAADQIKAYPDALDRAAKASYDVYQEESPGYWAKYYRGVVEKDKKGMSIALGGSRVSNLVDNLVLFGLYPGSGSESSSLYKDSVYTSFGKLVVQQYPNIVKAVPPYETAVNLQFLKALAAKQTPDEVATAKPDVTEFKTEGVIEPSNVIAKKNWNITFDTGKATFTPAATATLEELFNQLSTSGTAVEIHGHTDNVGNSDANKALSEARAFAVKAYLEGRAPLLFPENRFSIRSFGDSNPIAPNSTPEGRAKNRRVTILLGEK